jgi:acetyl esterase/lipase
MPLTKHTSRRRVAATALVAALLLLSVALVAGVAACGGSPGPDSSVGVSSSPVAAGASSTNASPASPQAAASSAPVAERPVIGPDGEVVAGAKAVYRDLAYGDDSALQKLDLYLPDNGDQPHPLLVAIHGGGFSGGDKEDGQLIPVLSGLTRGYAVASLGYRLSPKATFPAAISDVKAAIRWLRAHAEEYGLDDSRLALWGDSAGGNLAALAGTAGDTDAFRGPDPSNADQPETVQAVVDWFGPISFLRTDDDFRAAGYDHPSAMDGQSFLSVYLGAPLGDVRDKVRASDPITYLSPEDPPILIEHGTADATVPYPQSARLARAYAKVAGRDAVTLHLLPDAGHVDPVFYSATHLSEVLDWLDARLK